MRNKTHLWTRFLAALLSLVMVLGMLPTFGLAPVAYAADTATDDGTTTDDSTGSESENQGQQTNITGDYITLPITIRDFAADGMLFEFNELNETTFTRADDGTITWGTPTPYTKTDRLYSYDADGDGVLLPYTAVYNPTYWDLDSTDGSQTWEDGELVADYTGIRIYPAGATLFEEADQTKVSGANWYCLIADTDGNIVKVLDRTADKTNIDEIMEEVGGAYSVWSWRGASNVPYYSVLAKVTEKNMGQYRFGFYDTVYNPDDDYTTNDTLLAAGDTGYFYLGQKYNTTADHQSFYVTTGNNITINSYDNWKRIVCDSDGQIVAVIPVGNTDDYSAYQTSDYTIVMYSKWNTTTEDTTSHITTANMSEYQIVTPTCDVGGALFIERTINVNEANTKGFGLLYTLDSDYLHWLAEDNEAENLPNTTYYEYNYNYTTTPYEVGLWDETPTDKTPVAYATQDLYGAGIRTNLVTKELDPITGKPLYTETTVAFLAKYMEQIMAVPEIGDNGAYNMHHVMGVKLYDESKQYVGPNSPLSVYDLADIFRLNVTDGLGDYDTSKAKFDSRGLLFPHQATTWYDAAYYLLHMLWYDSPVDLRTGTEGQDGYGMPIPNYNRIHLVKATNADGEACYVFNAKYDGTTYDFKNGEIFNSHFGENETTETREYTVAYDRDGEEDGAYGNPMPVNRFDPLGPSGAGVNRGYTMSGDTYGDFAHDSDMVRAEYYDETNYNLTLEGHAQFVYHEDSNQYFTFTGDDDVYLYINGIRVLDVGGAHSISKVSINLNDVAAEIGLHDGGTYRFDFFYTERHGTAANFGIETNIQIADSSMQTTKTGYQNGVNTGYGGPVNKDLHVGYSFELKNNGTAAIYNLTFEDKDIDAYVGYDDIRINPQLKADGETPLYTFANDIYMIHWDAAGKMTYNAPGTFSEQDLKNRLAAGLAPGERIGIYGFKYMIPEDKWVTNYVLNEDGSYKLDSYGNKIVDNISFTNTVYTSANSSPDNKGTPLHGIADWKVVQMEVPYTAFHVYDWVHKNVSNDPNADTSWHSESVTIPWSKLEKYLQEEIDAKRITSQQLANAYIVRCTGSGNTDEHNQNSCVEVVDGRSIKYTSATTGKDTVFFLFKGISEKLDDLVFSFEVYTYGVTDNVYVLDYGLSVELAGQDFGFQNNDILTNNYNNNPVRITATVVNPTSNYGTFTHTSAVDDDENTSISSLKYTPNAIINDIDTVQVKIKIVETTKKTETNENGETVETDEIVEKVLDKYTGVEMIQTITTAPASIVYYEENFPGITYIEEGENNWIHYETVKEKLDENGDPVLDEDGNPVYESVAGTEQSADQDSNYGSDPNYEEDKTGMWDGEIIDTTTLKLDAPTSSLQSAQQSFIDYLNQYMGVSGQASNGTINVLEIKQTAKVLYFDFAGTGFEIISRTTPVKYAVINVIVDRIDTVLDAEGNVTETNYVTVAQRPVICESKGGDLYQVPIISITDLPHANYRVTVVGAAVAGVENRILYIDGIRIYGPLENDEALEYYNPEEYNATIYEVKDLIVAPVNPDDPEEEWDYRAVYADVGYNDEDELTLTNGTTFIEYTEGTEGYLVTGIDNPDDYLNLGPNNELYFEGNSATSVLVCAIKPIADYPDAARTIEIGAHRKVDAAHDNSVGYATLVYGGTAVAIWEEGYYNEEDEFVDLENTYSVYSGTEQYYSIDVNKLEWNEKGGFYHLYIGTNGNENGSEILALTNLKLAGYRILTISEVTTPDGDGGNNDEGSEEEGSEEEPEAVSFSLLMEPMVELYGLWRESVEEENKIPVNENLFVNSASFKASSVARGKNAILTVKASAEADTIEIVAPDGTVLAVSKCTRSVSGDVATFSIQWKVMDARGSVLEYTIRVYDAAGNISANTKTVTLKVK